MHKVIIALGQIERIVLERGIIPIKVETSGSHIAHHATEFGDAGVTFCWSLCFCEGEEQNDIRALLEYSVGVSPPDADFDYYPSITIGYGVSVGSWFVSYDRHEYGGESPIHDIAAEIGLEETTAMRLLTEREALVAIKKLSLFWTRQDE